MPEQKSDRRLTTVILTIAIIGAIYFGYRVISDSPDNNPENPFEYNIEHYKKSDSSLHHYIESGQIKLADNEWLGIALDATGQIFVTGTEKLLIFDKEYKPVSYNIGGTGLCIAVDEGGKSFIGMGDHIDVYDSSGKLQYQIKLEGNRPLTTSLSLSKEYLYVADAGGHIVWQFDKKGTIIQRIGEKDKKRDIPGFVIPSPFFDVAIDPDNFLWVVNPGRHSLENYTADGGLRSSWGHYAMELEGFCGCCNPTHMAILQDGSFVTSEKGIARVKVYNRIGELTSVVASAEQFDEGTEGLDIAVDSRQHIYILDPKRKQIRIFTKI
jgi:DNA-binding beta-propeller fold protein YncE